jgi:phosphoglycerate dehydrogenase-like enzyme
MNVLIGVISPAAIWVIPRHFVSQLQRDFPQHTFLEAWDRDTLRRLIPDADIAFTPFVDADVFPSATRLRWVQSPAVGVGNLMFPELLASAVVITSARGIRARSIAEHVIGVTIALARQLPLAFRAQTKHHWAQDQLEGAHTSVRTLLGQRMGIVGLGAIGIEVARIAAPFGFRVSAIRRRADQPLPDAASWLTPSGRLTACSSFWESDVVVLAGAPHARDQAAHRPPRSRGDEAARFWSTSRAAS